MNKATKQLHNSEVASSSVTLLPQYRLYENQKCFVAHSHNVDWSDSILNACSKVLPRYGLEPWYAANHFDPTETLRDKVVELIANSRYGIYDLSCWHDRSDAWRLPRNVLIELGISIALNRPALLIRHTSNEALRVPASLQGMDLLEFAGEMTLTKALEERVPQWLDIPPDRDWLNRYCIFGNRICSFREEHPRIRQWGQEKMQCHISDGLDKDHPGFLDTERTEIREAFNEVLGRYNDLTYDFLDGLLPVDGYNMILCGYCQKVRSSPLAIYWVLPYSPAETFINIGISIALETLFQYKIPKIILVRREQDLPSLLRGYEIVEVANSSEAKRKLKTFIPTVIQKVRQTEWRPRALPFITIIPTAFNNLAEEQEPEAKDIEEERRLDLLNHLHRSVDEFEWSVRPYNAFHKANIRTIRDLVQKTESDLLSLPNLGRKSVTEIKMMLSSIGLNLGMDISKIEQPTRDDSDFYTCFISYSNKDEAFAKRLYEDLQSRGVRCWFAPEALRLGEKVTTQINESIRKYDKLLLIISKHSISSTWVESEVQMALDRERRENQIILLPVQIDNAVLNTNEPWAASIRRTRHIGNFTEWKNHDQYQKTFERLFHDIKAKDSVDSSSDNITKDGQSSSSSQSTPTHNYKLSEAVAVLERKLIEETLSKTGNLIETAKQLGISRSTIFQKVRRYNITRELTSSSSATTSHLQRQIKLSEALAALEHQLIEEALIKNKYNVSRAATELGLSRRGLRLKLARLGISRPPEGDL